MSPHLEKFYVMTMGLPQASILLLTALSEAKIEFVRDWRPAPVLC
jgi:hypothetical protein